MGTLYWIVEYGKVFAGYLLLLFLWPSLVFFNHLRKKTWSYRFGFCVSVSVIMSNTVVLTLGLFHILNDALVRFLYYGAVIVSVIIGILGFADREYRKKETEQFPKVQSLYGRYNLAVVLGAFGILYVRHIKSGLKHFLYGQAKKLKERGIKTVVLENAGRYIRRLPVILRSHGLLAGVLIYGMAYLSYGAFQIHSYGYGDLYTHHEWIKGLTEGNIFAGGVYPEAMHCFIYCMRTLLGIRIDRALLFLQGIHAAVFFLSVYLLLRQVFYWRYTPVFVLMFFLTWDLHNADLIHSMFRLQITMPMEFGLYSVCLCPLYFTKYLNASSVRGLGKKISGCCWNENLFLFMITLAAAAAIHFHVLIMVLLLCAVFGIGKIRKIICHKYLLPLLAAGMGACLIALTPMAGALSQGMDFNGSIDWAISAMDGYESREMRSRTVQGKTAEENKTDKSISIPDILTGIYRDGYTALYGAEQGRWIFLMTVAAAGICLFAGQMPRMRFVRQLCLNYPPVILASVLYAAVYAMPMVGLPDMIPEGRFFAPGHMMMLAAMMIGTDLLYGKTARFCSGYILEALSLVSIVGIYVGAVITGNFRGFLFYELTRYNSAVMVTDSLMAAYPRNSYTIVSPTDELGQIDGYGWHEELLSFVEKCEEENYVIPTEYVFIYVEKKPLLYAQSHFFSGSPWMGEEKYLQPYWKGYSFKYPDSAASQSPEIKAAQISGEAANQELPEYENPWQMYLKADNRTILESRAYAWCRRFSEQYPDLLKVYYEDDAFVCYYFRQDTDDGFYPLGNGQDGRQEGFSVFNTVS